MKNLLISNVCVDVDIQNFFITLWKINQARLNPLRTMVYVSYGSNAWRSPDQPPYPLLVTPPPIITIPITNFDTLDSIQSNLVSFIT